MTSRMCACTSREMRSASSIGTSTRANEAYVKRFVESENTIMLMVDVSASLRFGSRQELKREVAAMLGALGLLSG